MSDKVVVSWYIDFGKQGELEGLFICTQKELDLMVEENKNLYFSDALGRHSEVMINTKYFVKDNCQIESSDQEFIAKLEELKTIPIGLDVIRSFLDEFEYGDKDE